MQKVIITAPSLDPTQNVSGVSSVARFIIENNTQREYVHFCLGRKDKEKGGWRRVFSIFRAYSRWKKLLSKERRMKSEECENGVIVHYSFPLSAASIIRDPLFMYYAYNKVKRYKIKGTNNYGMVVHVHGGLFLTAPKIPFILNRILKWVFSWDVPFIVLSEKEKRILQERFGAKKVEVLPNCPSMPERIGLEVRGERLEKHRVLTMGYLGRIEPNKGMTELLKACQQLKKEGVDFKLRFAGKEQVEGEYIPLFRQWLNDNDNSNDNEKFFEYVGLVSGESKDAFLRSLDVFVMPTYFEGLPMSLLECMAYGVVPVVTPVGSIPEVVKDNDELQITNYEGSNTNDANGVFVKVKDVDSIVEAVKYLDAHRDIVAHLSENARKTIMDNLSASKYVEKLNDIYNLLYV